MAVTYTLRYRPAGSGSWTEVTGLTSTSRAVSGLTAGTEYEVEVVAVSDGGVESTPVTGGRWTVCPQPSVPSGSPAGYRLSSGADENGAVDVSWSAVTGADSYTVSHRPTGGSTWTDVPGVSGTSTRIDGLAGGSTHEVRVAAVNADGDTSASSTAATGLDAVVATGGTVTRVPTSGTPTHIVHTFTADGTLELNRGRDADVLVVAGGGGGGSGDDSAVDGGGGGAGGLVFKPAHAVAAASYAVVVGAGGAAEQNGSDSSIDGLVAVGGGAAGQRFGSTTAARGGQDGGSGGGARQNAATGPGGSATQRGRSGDSGTYGHGHDGAAASGNAGGGGGGGAGGAATGLDGGVGLDRVTVEPTTYVFTTVFGTGIGDGGWFASGGAAQGGTASVGGGVDGQDENATVDVSAAPSGTGGGGGGANDDGDQLGGAGGSGVVIVRYPLPT